MTNYQEQLDEIQASILELQQYRKIWLTDNLSLINDLFLLVSQAGVSVAYEYRYPWNDHKILAHRKGEVEIRCFYNMGQKFSPQINAFIETDKMRITYKKTWTVCRYTFTNDPVPDTRDNLFVPGSWFAPLIPEIKAAQTADLQQQIESESRKLAQLEKELLIGENI